MMVVSMWQEHPAHYEFRRGTDHNKETVIVMMHGLGFTMTSWDLLWDRFDHSYSVLRFNLVGHGGRAYQPFESIDEQVQDLLALLQHLAIGNVHLVGHGLGGNIGLLFAIQYPDRVRSLTILSSHLIVLESVYDDLLSYRRSYAVEDTLAQLGTLMASLTSIEESHQSVIRESFTMMQPNAYFNHIHQPMFQEYNRQVLAHTTLSTPILHLVGEYDSISPPYLYGVYTALFANARFLVLPHASNAVHMDCPDVVATLIGEFIHAPSAGNVHTPVRSSTLHQEMLQRVVTNSRPQDHISIQLIGAFIVRANGVVVSGNWNQRKAQPLLAYLVFHPLSTRDRLCEELWPDHEFQQARNYLRASLHHLKSLLEGAFLHQPFLRVDRQAVSLKGNIDCDVVELLYSLQNVIPTADSPLNVEEIQRVMHQLHPDSLALFAHEPWFWPIRKKVESRFITAVKRLGDEYFDQGHYVLAIEAWEHGLSFDEFDESFYQRIIHSMECLQDGAGIRLWRHRRDQAINELR